MISKRIGILSLLGVLLLLSGIVGAQDETRLRLATWQWEDPAYAPFWTGSVEAFNAANEGVVIEPFNFPIDQLWDRLNIEIAAGSPPDLIEVTGFNVFQYIDQGVLAPLNECFAGTDIIDNVLAQDSYAVDEEGNIYALNLSARTLQLYVNMPLFEAAGVEVPTNFEEFMAAAMALTDPSQEQYGLVLTNLAHSRLYEGVLVMVAGYGGHFSENGEPAFTSEAVINGVQFFKDMFDAGVMPQGVADGGAQYSFFNSGNVAMSIDGSWYWAVLNQNAPEVAENVEIFAIPTDTQAPTGGVNNLIGIAAGSPNFDVACEYLKSIATPEWAQLWTASSGTINALEGSVPQEFIDANPWFETFANELPAAIPVAIPGLEVYHNDMVRLVNNRIVEILYNNRPVAEAMADLQSDVEEFLEDME